jgi:hypothetical protein
MKSLRRKSRAHEFLKQLALGAGILVVSLASPMGGAKLVQEVMKEYFRRRRFERYRFLKDLKNLQSRELIDYRDLGNDEVKITLTKQGADKILEYKFDDIKLKTTGRWDRKWRLIMFDIPHEYRRARDAFRAKLLKLNFYPIQKSVYITPYPCEEEIDFIATIFNVRKYVLILYVKSFEGEEKLRHHFGI